MYDGALMGLIAGYEEIRSKIKLVSETVSTANKRPSELAWT